MIRNKKLVLFVAYFMLTSCSILKAQDTKPDTVRTGIYVTSIHDIDFRQKEYTVTFWLWLKYKNRDFDFLHNLEIPQAKTYTTSFSTIDTTAGRVYILMKVQAVMKDSWKTENFPFDRQKLRLSVENSQFDSKLLVFKVDTLGKHYDPRFTLRGWNIVPSASSLAAMPKSSNTNLLFPVAVPDLLMCSLRMIFFGLRSRWIRCSE